LGEGDITMFDGVPVDKLTAPLLLLLAVLMVFLGLLVPRYVYKAKEKECEAWKAAYFAERDARMAANSQTVELLELAKTSNNVLQAMFSSTGHSTPRTGGNKWDSGDAIRRPRKQQGVLWPMLKEIFRQ
jgi:Na+-transporting methylmalonyl-CoA/oxaloacetate decarboxylase gamma subunit